MSITVRGGAFCSPEGASGESTIGTPLVCASSDGGRARWRKQAGTTATNAGTDAGYRRGVLTKLRKLGIKVKRGTPIEELEQLLANPPAGEDADQAAPPLGAVELLTSTLNEKIGELAEKAGVESPIVDGVLDPDKAESMLAAVKPEVGPELPTSEPLTPLADVEAQEAEHREREREAKKIRANQQSEAMGNAVRPPAEPGPAAPATPTAPSAPPAGPAPLTVSTGNPVTARPENHWGADGKAEISYHWDGMIGRTVDHELGDAGRTIHVDGRPLGDHLEVLASRTVKGELHPQDQVTEVRRVAEALPEGREKRVLQNLAKELDAPPVTIDLPAGTPARLVKLAEDVAKIPLARGAGYGEQHELEAIREVANRYARGETNGNGLIRELRQRAHNRRHESKEGKIYLDAVIREGVRDLEQTKRQWRNSSS